MSGFLRGQGLEWEEWGSVHMQISGLGLEPGTGWRLPTAAFAEFLP